MPYYDLVVDPHTGAVTMKELAAKTPEAARAELEQLRHDCPLCQEARARGEQPTFIDAGDMSFADVMNEARRYSGFRSRERMRWRQRKQRPR